MGLWRNWRKAGVRNNLRKEEYDRKEEKGALRGSHFPGS